MNRIVQSFYSPPVTKRTVTETRMDTGKFMTTQPLFAGLSEAQLTQLERDVVARRYEPGTQIFREGDAGQLLYLIQSGQVRIFVNGLGGTETDVILFGRPGELFGELSVIDGLPRSATAVALDETVLLTIGREPFRQHMRNIPRLAMNFMQILSKRVRYNTYQIDSFARLSVSQRLARKLLELVQDFGRVQEDGVFIDMYLPQTVLAGMIGATREMVNRCLRKFREAGWIKVSQGYITIFDPEALRSEVSQ